MNAEMIVKILQMLQSGEVGDEVAQAMIEGRIVVGKKEEVERPQVHPQHPNEPPSVLELGEIVVNYEKPLYHSFVKHGGLNACVSESKRREFEERMTPTRSGVATIPLFLVSSHEAMHTDHARAAVTALGLRACYVQELVALIECHPEFVNDTDAGGPVDLVQNRRTGTAAYPGRLFTGKLIAALGTIWNPSSSRGFGRNAAWEQVAREPYDGVICLARDSRRLGAMTLRAFSRGTVWGSEWSFLATSR